jgi:ABC-type branched-subunit amino acid transport system ATPase component
MSRWLSDPLLKVEGLTMRFGGLTAVSDFHVSVGRGDITALIGPNGAGKTTVFNCITGFYKPTQGRLTLARKGAASPAAVEALTKLALNDKHFLGRLINEDGVQTLVTRAAHQRRDGLLLLLGDETLQKPRDEQVAVLQARKPFPHVSNFGFQVLLGDVVHNFFRLEFRAVCRRGFVDDFITAGVDELEARVH